MTVGEPIRAEISAFFSYAHGDDDDFGIVSAFYRKFKEIPESKGRRDIVPFLDIADLEQYGPLDQNAQRQN